MSGERNLVTAGVKIRISACPSPSGGSTKTLSLNVHLAREALHLVVVEPARVGEHGELVAGQRRSVKTSATT